MLGMSMCSKGHDFRTNSDIKWEYVIKQNHTRYFWVWTSYLWFVSRLTNDTVKGTGFVTVRSQMKAHICTEYWITSTSFWRMQNTL